MSDDDHLIAVVQNEEAREHVKANALQMAASSAMLAALKAVDAHLIGVAMKNAQARGFDVSWEKAEVMFGVSDLHAQIRSAIQLAEVGR